MNILPHIDIMPIGVLYSVLAKIDSKHNAAIIASSYEVDTANIPIPHIAEYFDDLDRDVQGHSLSLDQAKMRTAHYILMLRQRKTPFEQAGKLYYFRGFLGDAVRFRPLLLCVFFTTIAE